VRVCLSKSARNARFSGLEPVRLRKLLDVRIRGAPAGCEIRLMPHKGAPRDGVADKLPAIAV